MKVLKTQYKDQVGMFKSLYENNNGFFYCKITWAVKSENQAISSSEICKLFFFLMQQMDGYIEFAPIP
jgi:hypothetical protein